MDKRLPSGRGEPIPSILKKPKGPRKGDFVDKSSKIKREKVEIPDKKGEDVSAPLPHGCTPLMYACQQADYKAVVDILNKDPASVRARDRGLRCALHYCASSSAAVSGASRAACADRVLMAAPALAGARDADGLTPLHLAVVHGDVPLVQALLAAGADVNATDDEHHTVVHWATVCGEVGALRAVLAAGAGAATPDQHGGYPLHYAAQMCGAPATTDHQSRGAALEVLRALLREGGAAVAVRDADGRSPLLWAASAGAAAAVLALHQAGAGIDDADRDGLTALHCAAARGHTEALETLMGLCGARVDAADTHGCTPLHYAAALGHADATALLLQHGADAHRQDRRGRSPAHTAAAKGQIETVRMLGARGANLWLRNSKGDLPLHEAVASGRRELVKWLLDGRPSQVNATNHEGKTPLHVAAATDNADLCRLLLDRGSEINPVARSGKNEPITPLNCATSRGHRSTAKYLQMHGGLPAAKLTNTQIILDGAPITSLPTRKVTSTKIDVRDRIRIEKREVVEVSSPLRERRHYRGRQNSNSPDSSSEERKTILRTKNNRFSGKSSDRRKRVVEPQKSFSDGYDTELESHKHNYNDKKYKKSSKKSRSRSEPCSRRNKGAHSSTRRSKYSHSESESSSEPRSCSGKKKNKRHRKRSKRKSSLSSESTSESSERRNTKRKGKKTSIHIENDDEKQSVNIINFKGVENTHNKDSKEGIEESSAVSKTEIQIATNEDEGSFKNKQQSETETDTISLKTSMVVTEAQIHVGQESNQTGGSEITVTVDALNNVVIETANVPIKCISEPMKSEENVKSSTDKESQGIVLEPKPNGILNPSSDGKIKEIPEVDTKCNDDIQTDHIEQKNNNVMLLTVEGIGETTENKISDSPISEVPIQKVRKRSFQVLTEPEHLVKSSDENVADINKNEIESTNLTPSVSFANKEIVFDSTDLEKSCDNFMGERVDKEFSKDNLTEETPGVHITGSGENQNTSSVGKRKEYVSTTASSTELVQSSDKDTVPNTKSLVTKTDNSLVSTTRAVQQVVMDTVVDDINLQLGQTSPQRPRKSSKDSQSSSRKSSLYETESYKVLSDIASATESGPGILKKTANKDISLEVDRESGGGSDKYTKDNFFDRVPSVSDNEIYNQSEANGKRKKFRKKSRGKSRSTMRSKSENSERGYESSGLMDSGFEPSPRVVQRNRAMSPRLAAYYQQRNATGRYSGKSDSRIPIRKPGDKKAVDMKSVTQRIQTNMRRYYCERKIFQHLLELKRLQIRTSKTNESVLVKRSIDEYNKSSLANVGLGPYNNPDFSFSSFESFLYESLRKLQRSGKKHLENLPERPMDFDYGESELYKMSAIPDNPCLCTNKTHRCFHAIHAYTGIPCSAYIPHKLNHHTMPKPNTAGGITKTKGFLPKIDAKPPTGTNKAHVTLEVSHGNERQLIALPAERLDTNKRYYVTFTVKGSEPPSDNDNATSNATPNIKSVRTG